MSTWIVTGISNGLGKSIAQAAMDAGHYVHGCARNADAVASFNQSSQQNGKAVVLDVTDLEAVTAWVQGISDNGPIDVLVNNAGAGTAGSVEETHMEVVREIMEVNFFAVAHLTQLMLPVMRKQGAGRIIQISSHGGIKAFPGFGIYNASKFALEGYSEALAAEVAPLGIHVSLVEPGPFRTQFAGSSLQLSERSVDAYARTAHAFQDKLSGVHGQQEGDPDKAAAAILDLVNEPNPSLRLPLGTVPLKTIQMKLDSVAADLERNREVAAGAVFVE